MFKTKSYVIGILVLVSMLIGIVFGDYQIFFSPASTNIRLYCTSSTIYVVMSGPIYNGFSAYIPYVTGTTYTSHTVNGVSSFNTPQYVVGTCNQIGDCDTFAGNMDQGSFLSAMKTGGRFVLQNSGYIRTATIRYSAISPQADTKMNSGATQEFLLSNGTLLSGVLDVSLYPFPCTGDTAIPTFGFTGGMSPHLTNYTGPQFNDRIYIFDLRDMGGINDFGFYTGYLGDPWGVDRTGGSNYSTSASVLNGSGIALETFRFDIGVETLPDSSSFTTITITGTLNYTGGGVITGSTGDLLFYPYAFIWNRWNRNYTGSLTTGALWSSSTLDIDGNWSFGTEREVVLTGRVSDRADLWSVYFQRHFNYGTIPRSSNKQASGLVQYCGPNGSQFIGVVAPTVDSGAYIDKYNSGFYLRPFKVYLHDDWAGIDSGTIVVTLTGYQGGALTTIVFTGPTPSVNLGLTAFSRTGPINVATTEPGNPTKAVYSVSGSTRNYEVTINYTGKWDSETRIGVAINYKDLVSRTGTTVTCSYYNSYDPYVNNWTGDIHLNRTPFASGARLSGFAVRFEDEWAGIDSGSTVLTITGNTIIAGTRSTTPISFTFSSGTTPSVFTLLSQYSTHTGSTSGLIIDGQQFNYLLTMPENVNGWTGYFAPEFSVTIVLTYKDKLGNIQSGTKQYSNYYTGFAVSYVGSATRNPSQTLLNKNDLTTPSMLLNPLLRSFFNLTNDINTTARWIEAFPLGTFASTSGNTQFSGLQFAIMDRWAGVDSGYNFVVLTGSRRGNAATYMFTTSDSTGRNRSSWTSCGLSTNCLTGDMSKIAQLVPDYDQFTGQHPTIQGSTGYQFQITGHSIYFDYGTFSGLTELVSRYGIAISGSDLRPDTPNTTSWSTGLALTSLQCQFLNRCSHDQLTFVRGPNITSDLGGTITQNPLTGNLSPNGDPFTGSIVSVVGSVVTIDTGLNVIFCSTSTGALDSPITLDFISAPNLTGASTGSYQSVTLKVADGLFELTGTNNDVLIVR